MLGIKLLQVGNAGAARQFIERSVSLVQSDDLMPVIKAGQQFTKTPDSAFVDWKTGSAALSPESFENGGVYSDRVPIGIYEFQQIATTGAAEVLFCLLADNTAPNTSQLRRLNRVFG